MAKVRFYAKALIVAVALFLALRYWGGFSSRQSLLLAGLSVIGWDLYESVRLCLRAERAFSPFWVRVSPNWYGLLRDFKLFSSDEDEFWRRVKPTSEYNVLRNDIVFTVLKPGLVDGLLYWNSRQAFVSEMNFEERIEEIKIGPPNLRTGFGWSPDVYFKWGTDGYELGLEVNAEWWKKTCADDETKQLAKTRTDPQHLTGSTRLVIAVLPYSEFGIYMGGNAPVSLFDTATLKNREKRKGAELTKAGWKREEKDAELDLLGAPDCVEHKYFTIEHRPI